MITKKDIIKIADAIIRHNKDDSPDWNFHTFHLETIADAIQSTNPRFNKQRFLDYIKGRCGPNGGKIK